MTVLDRTQTQPAQRHQRSTSHRTVADVDLGVDALPEHDPVWKLPCLFPNAQLRPESGL
jgi:hypothetical protein